MNYLYPNLVFLNIMDAYLTMVTLSGGVGREANPAMAAVISMGWLPFFLIKIIASLTVCYLVWKLRYKKLQIVCLILFTLFYLFVVANNLAIYVR